MKPVRLTWVECSVAAKIGAHRRLTSMREGFKDKAGRPDDFNADIQGAAAEIAFAKCLKMHWEPSNKTFSIPDVGDIEVKLSRKIPELPVRTNTADDQIVALVMGGIPDFTVMGWILGIDAKKIPPTTKVEGYYSCHWVPVSMLHDIDNIVGGRNEKAQA